MITVEDVRCFEYRLWDFTWHAARALLYYEQRGTWRGAVLPQARAKTTRAAIRLLDVSQEVQ